MRPRLQATKAMKAMQACTMKAIKAMKVGTMKAKKAGTMKAKKAMKSGTMKAKRKLEEQLKENVQSLEVSMEHFKGLLHMDQWRWMKTAAENFKDLQELWHLQRQRVQCLEEQCDIATGKFKIMDELWYRQRERIQHLEEQVKHLLTELRGRGAGGTPSDKR